MRELRWNASGMCKLLNMTTRGLVAMSLIAVAGTAAAAEGRRATFQEEQKRLANANTVTIISSSTSSTYTRFIEDMQNVLDDLSPNGMRVLPVLGRGGGQNFRDVLFLRGIDIATTESSYLQYFKSKEPNLFGNAEQRVHYIAKLFNAEFHILAAPHIRSVHDLRGQRVNFWKELSISALAAETIFKTLGVEVIPTHYDSDLAIEKMRSGEIVATVRMSGAPHNDYAGVTANDRFHLLPLDQRSMTPQQSVRLMEIYIPSELTHDHYPDLIPKGARVPTLAGSIVLAVYNWPEGSDRYEKTAHFVRKFFDNFDKFHDPARHPKWRDVNLAATVPGWTRFKAAQEWLDANKSRLAQPVGTMQAAFERFLSERERQNGRGLSKPAQEKLYRDFEAWWQDRPSPAVRN
jgi:TRAP-type uncharacterized transport system substrate-binding protein